MRCRVGITTNLIERFNYWSSRHPTLQNWTILAQFQSKEEAQAFETKYAFRNNCMASPGGSGPLYATWYVYYFNW